MTKNNERIKKADGSFITIEQAKKAGLIFEKDIDVLSNRPDWRITLQADHIKRLEEELKAKEQECEQLKITIEENSYRYAELDADFEQSKKECEELKAENNTYKSSIVANLDKSISKRYRELLEENDQLKAENEELKKQLMQKSEVDMFFNTPIEGWSNDLCGICKYKQTLTEIKEIANKTLWTYPNIDDVTKYNMFDKILQKINEVEDDKNM